jgi:hypothetical protein
LFFFYLHLPSSSIIDVTRWFHFLHLSSTQEIVAPSIRAAHPPPFYTFFLHHISASEPPTMKVSFYLLIGAVCVAPAASLPQMERPGFFGGGLPNLSGSPGVGNLGGGPPHIGGSFVPPFDAGDTPDFTDK